MSSQKCSSCKQNIFNMVFYTSLGERRCAWCVNRKKFPFQPVFNPPKR